MRIFLLMFLGLFLSTAGCGDEGGGGGGGGDCPSSQDAEDAGVTGADLVVSCEGCNSGSDTFSCPETGDSVTVTCVNGVIDPPINSTEDCTEATLTCFNGTLNRGCVDTASE